jgi:hypothetical protein
MENLGGAIAWMGFDGVLLDTEVGSQVWSWLGIGNTGNQFTTNSLVASRGQAWVEALNTGAGFDVPIYTYQSIAQGATFPGTYTQYYNAYNGNATATATGMNDSVYPAFLYGMAKGTTAPIVSGETVFYSSGAVWTTHGPFGTGVGTGSAGTASWNAALDMTLNGATPYTYGGVTYKLPGFNNLTVNLSGTETPLPPNVYLTPMLWIPDNNESDENTETTPASGIWTTGWYAAALPALLEYCQHNTWSIFQEKEFVDYANSVGVIGAPPITIPAPGYHYTPVNG